MPRLNVANAIGESQVIEAPEGMTVMIALRDHGQNAVSEDFGLCGGCCTCYTCHLWVDPADYERLTPPSAQEQDLLGLASHRRSNSRLACQILLTDALDGLGVTLPPID